MSADDLIASLGAQGKLERQGAFALDAQKAREKMAQFQLSDPHHYVLELVQAAHLLGARALYFRIDIDEVELWFEGEGLNDEDLAGLYVAAFERSDEPKRQAMRHLAIAINATRTLQLRELVVEGKGPGYAAKLSVYDEREVIEQGCSLEAPGLRFYARQRARLSHVREFFTPRHDPTEKYLLRERCGFASRPIVLNGQDIAMGMRLPAEVEGIVGFSTEHEHGLLGCLREDDGDSQIRLMQHGVLLETRRLPAKRLQVSAIVDSVRLRKDLSQSAFVQDDAMEHLLNVVLRQAMYESLGAIASEELEQQLDDVARSELRARYAPLLGSLLEELPVLSAQPKLQASLVSVIARLEAHKLLKRADSAQERFLSLSELRGCKVLRYSMERQLHLAFDEEGPVLFASSLREVEGIAQYLGVEAPEDYTDALRLKERYRFNRSLWALRRFEGLKEQLVSLTCKEGELSLTWSWSGTSSKARFIFVKDGCLLRQELLEGVALPGVTLLIAGPLKENDRFDDVVYDDALLALLRRGIELLPSLMSEIGVFYAADKLQRRWLLLAYMQALLEGTLHTSVLKALGCEASSQMAQWGERLMSEARPSVMQWAIGLLDRLSSSRVSDRDVSSAPLSPWSVAKVKPREAHLKRLERFALELGYAATASLFKDLLGQWFSFSKLLDVLERHQTLKYISALTPAERFIELLEKDKEPIFALSEQEIKALESLFGAGRLLHYEELLGAELAKRRFMAQPTREPVLKERGVFSAKLKHPQVHGELVWRFDLLVLEEGELLTLDGDDEMVVGRVKQLDAVVDYKSRPLGTLSWSWPLGSVAAHVNTTLVTPEIGWMKIYEDERSEALERILEREAQEALLDWLRLHHRDAYKLPTRERVFLWDRMGVILHDVQLLAPELGPLLYNECRQLMCFEGVDGKALSVAAVEELLRGEAFLHYVLGQASVMRSLLKVKAPAVVLRLPELNEVKDALNLIFLNHRLIDCSSTDENERAHRRALEAFMKRPQLDVWSEGFTRPEWGERFFFEEERVKGAVVMCGSTQQWVEWPSLKLSVLYEDRPLEQVELLVPFGRFELFLKHEDLSVSADLQRVDDPLQRQRLQQLALEWSLDALLLWLKRLGLKREWMRPGWDAQVLWLWGLLCRGDGADRSPALRQARGLLSRWPKLMEALRSAKLFKAWLKDEAWSWDELIRSSAPIWVVIGQQASPKEAWPDGSFVLGVPDHDAFDALCAALAPRMCYEHVESPVTQDRQGAKTAESKRGSEAEEAKRVARAGAANQEVRESARAQVLEQRVLERARELVLEAVSSDERLLVGGQLDPLVLEEWRAGAEAFAIADGQKILINRAHQGFVYALEGQGDDVFAQAFVSSCVYSAMNVFYEQVKESHELEFHERMVELLLRR